jgi:hypothetical protein
MEQVPELDDVSIEDKEEKKGDGFEELKVDIKEEGGKSGDKVADKSGDEPNDRGVKRN